MSPPNENESKTPKPTKPGPEDTPPQGGIAGFAAMAAEKAGEIARAGGEVIASAGDHLRVWNEKHQATETTDKALSKEGGGAKELGESPQRTENEVQGMDKDIVTERRDQPETSNDSTKPGGIGGLAAATSAKAGEIARAGGDVAAKAGDHVSEWNEKHQVTEKTGAALSKAGETLEHGRDWVSKKFQPTPKDPAQPADKPSVE